MPDTCPKLSLCLIVKNEERFLEGALAQAKPYCDEIIVVDTGSTDGTVAIAKAAGAEVLHFEWTRDFSAARNFSIAKASCDWILVLDADERVEEKDWEKIKAALQSPSTDAYDLIQINYANTPALVGFKTNEAPVAEFAAYPGYTESPLTRLFRAGKGFRFDGAVHEHLYRDSSVVDGQSLPVRIHHHGQALSPEKMRAKKEFYLGLGREKVRRRPADFKARHELGIAHWELGDFAEAEKELSEAKAIDPAEARNLMALATVKQLRGDLCGAETIFRGLIETAPRDPSVHAALGCCLKKQGRLDDAIAAFKRQIEIEPAFSQARLWLSEVYAERRFKNPDAKPSLSVCYIVKNEADCLVRSLENVRAHCDEIIVVDTGSSDATVEVARASGAKVFSAPWRDDFAWARNVSLKHATSEWILVLDADEVLGEKDWQALSEATRRSSVPMHFLVQTTYSNLSTVLNWRPNDIAAPEASGYKGYFESPLVRLFRNTPRIRFHGAVHEHALHDDGTLAASTCIRIHHYGKFREPARMREKYELYHKIGVKKAEINPNEAQAHYELAVQRMELGIDEGVEEGFQNALRIDPVFGDALLAYANYLLEKKRLAAALECFMRLIAARPKDPQAYVYTASLLIDIGKYDLALRMLETARDLGGENNVALLMNEGVIFLRLKDAAQAEDRFRRAYALNPEFTPVLVNLGIALTLAGKGAEAESIFRRAVELNPKCFESRQKLAELLFNAGHPDESLKYFLLASELAPQNPDLMSQVIINAHALGRDGVVEDFEARLVALAGDPSGRSALERIAALYKNRRDDAATKRLSALLAPDAR